MSYVRVSREEHIVTITLDRPVKKNAISGPMYDEMTAAIENANATPEARAILLRGEGGDFCSGNDIAEFIARSESVGSSALAFIRALARNAKPLVAAAQGACVGIGATMLLHCDLVFAAPSARFRFPFIDLALVPEAASSLLLPRRVGEAKAAEWLMLGTPFDAQEALENGFINAVADEARLHLTARSAARALASKPAGALATTRRLLRGNPDGVLARIDEEAAAFGAALQSPEAQAAFRSFLDRSRA